MVKGQKEARIGLDAEKDIIFIINNKDEIRKTIKNCLSSFGITLGEKCYAVKPKNKEFIKTDILLCCTQDKNMIGISLKTVKDTAKGFHQIDRRKLEDWKDILGMSDDIYNVFKESILRVARNSRDKFIQETDQPLIKGFVKNHLDKILHQIFVRDEGDILKIFAVYDIRREHNTLYLINLNEFIKELASKADVSFSKKGIIQIVVDDTPIITIQRKGGNGQHVKKYKKIDWEHPGNQLQFKMKPISVVEFLQKHRKDIICKIDII